MSTASYHTAKRKQTQRKYQWNDFVWLLVVVAVCKCCVATWSHTFSKVCTTFLFFLHHISCLLACVVFFIMVYNTLEHTYQQKVAERKRFWTIRYARRKRVFFGLAAYNNSIQSYVCLSSHWIGIQLAYLIHCRNFFPPTTTECWLYFAMLLSFKYVCVRFMHSNAMYAFARNRSVRTTVMTTMTLFSWRRPQIGNYTVEKRLMNVPTIECYCDYDSLTHTHFAHCFYSFRAFIQLLACILFLFFFCLSLPTLSPNSSGKIQNSKQKEYQLHPYAPLTQSYSI